MNDYFHVLPARLLQATLADFLPSGNNTVLPDGRLIFPAHIYPGYHLAYFANPTQLSTLLPDGTDPLHSPGPPFDKRMWAGGQVYFTRTPLWFSKGSHHCSERIIDVQLKGRDDEEKVFVQIERTIFPGRYPFDPLEKNRFRSTRGWSDATRERRDWQPIPDIKEERTLVFMRDNRRTGSTDIEKAPRKILKPTIKPDFSHTLIPTPALLFRFSALTFNAHAIHLDKQYCHEVEGHRNLLVHGPLSLVLMLEVLRGYIKSTNPSTSERDAERLVHIEYRNMAPLYAEEEMKVCVKLKATHEKERVWDVWVENRDGGYAVKGLAKSIFQVEHTETEDTEESENAKMEPPHV